jgi:5-methylcytosine-specific restriction endonuclease McrBC regulatory subunit McrC
VLILDTKYKELARDQRRLGIAEGDMYQMLAYAVALNCPRTLLLYPERANSLTTSVRFETLSQSHSVMVATINLGRPLDHPEGTIQQLAQIFREVLSYDPRTEV